MELLKEQTNVNETTNSNSSKEELVIREELEGTPFILIRTKGNWFLTLGQYRISGEYKNKKDLLETIKGVDWLTITNVIGAIVETTLKVKEEENELRKQNNKL